MFYQIYTSTEDERTSSVNAIKMDNNKIHEKTDKQIVKTCATVIRKKQKENPTCIRKKVSRFRIIAV